MADFASTWQLGGIVLLVAALRLAYTFWRDAPYRAGVLEIADSGLVAFVLVFLVIRPFVVQSFYIPSDSMEPTLVQPDRLLVSKFIYRLTAPRRGDIIVFRAPARAHALPGREDYIKRVIALGGEIVQVRGPAGVFINDRRLIEPYIAPDRMADYYFGPYRVPPGSLFVLGDNRRQSQDSHVWLTLPRERVLGKAMLVFWPPSRLGMVGHGRPALAPAGNGAAADTAPEWGVQ